MAAPAIRSQGLSKEYALGGAAHDTLYDLLTHAFRRGGGAAQQAARLWALQDVDFEVVPGEILGIMGRNGAGKSTLLKILSRITPPTRGRVEVRGRLASLLEVGTGFHPELTGRENIFLNGAILGMSRREVARKFDAIVGFADVAAFLDTPVKRYSSGMYVRLAFAVAAHLEADILLVDEILAVGDAEFQRKCIGTMNEVGRSGRTVIVVSHNLSHLSQLCTTGLWLERGRVAARGSFETVSAQYLRNTAAGAPRWTPDMEPGRAFAYEQVWIASALGQAPGLVPASQPFEVVFDFRVAEAMTGRIAFSIADAFGTVVLSSANTDAQPYLAGTFEPGRHRLRCRLPGHLLAPGTYHLSVSRPGESGDEVLANVCEFEVDATDSLRSRDGRPGVVAPLLHWQPEALA